MDLIEKILNDLINHYLCLSDLEIDLHIKNPNFGIKERVETIDDLQVIIYSDDHNPPHFHVKTKSKKINAKFKIENCELISGEISSKDLKKIKAFYLSPKGKAVLQAIWNKRLN